MKATTRSNRSGFTLIELLVVIAIIGTLAAILVPLAGNAKQSAMKRRATVEMNSIKVAVLQFYAEHRYMPWGDPTNATARVGDDVWTANEAERINVMKWLTGDNPKNKAYLQIPEKSRQGSHPLLFTDPWKQDYRIGLDRNMDGSMLPNDPDHLFNGYGAVKEKVLVYSLGNPDVSPSEPLRSFDLVPP